MTMTMTMGTCLSIFALEQHLLVEFPRRLRNAQNIAENLLGAFLLAVECAEIVRGQPRFYTSERAKEKDGIEVDVLESLGVRGDSVDEALEVRALFTEKMSG